MQLILNVLIVYPSWEWAVGIDRNYSLFLTSPPTKVPTASAPLARHRQVLIPTVWPFYGQMAFGFKLNE